MLKPKFNIIAAFCKANRGIGYKNDLPWKSIPKDMRHFKNLTIGEGNNAVIMGRKTYESIPEKFRPLPLRRNIVVSRNYNCHSIDQALDESKDCNQRFIIGGGSIYQQVINRPEVDKIFITEVDGNFKSNVYFPEIPEHFKEIERKTVQDGELKLDFVTYQNMWNIHSEEYQYLNVINRILKEGEERETRNSKVISLFGDVNLQFDLTQGFPLLTTKKMFLRGIIEELLFFLRGNTDSKILSNKKIRIWEKNTSREFLHSRGLDYQEGDMGPMYGWNWRHFGAKYRGCRAIYTGQGYDQLKKLIETIKSDPTSRRLLLTTYDPSKVSQSVLAPCHGLVVQFYVRESKYLDCKMYQRSCDWMLGVPFNIASYALLVVIISNFTNYTPGKLYLTFGDAHIYENHIDAAKKQIERKPYYFPKLEFNPKIPDNFFNLDIDDFKLKDYNHQSPLKIKMIA